MTLDGDLLGIVSSDEIIYLQHTIIIHDPSKVPSDHSDKNIKMKVMSSTTELSSAVHRS